MNYTIIFATQKEARSTIERLGGKKAGHDSYTTEEGRICIIGMGTRDLAPFTPYFEMADIILNVGLAGSLDKKLARDSFHPIRQVSYMGKTIHLGDTGASLETVDTPLHTWQEGFELVDMEGYHIAAEAARLQKPCRLYKIVSDYCNAQTSEEIHTRLPILSSKLANHMNDIINEAPNVIPTGSFT